MSVADLRVDKKLYFFTLPIVETFCKTSLQFYNKPSYAGGTHRIRR